MYNSGTTSCFTLSTILSGGVGENHPEFAQKTKKIQTKNCCLNYPVQKQKCHLRPPRPLRPLPLLPPKSLEPPPAAPGISSPPAPLATTSPPSRLHDLPWTLSARNFLIGRADRTGASVAAAAAAAAGVPPPSAVANTRRCPLPIALEAARLSSPASVSLLLPLLLLLLLLYPLPSCDRGTATAVDTVLSTPGMFWTRPTTPPASITCVGNAQSRGRGRGEACLLDHFSLAEKERHSSP